MPLEVIDSIGVPLGLVYLWAVRALELECFATKRLAYMLVWDKRVAACVSFLMMWRCPTSQVACSYACDGPQSQGPQSLWCLGWLRTRVFRSSIMKEGYKHIHIHRHAQVAKHSSDLKRMDSVEHIAQLRGSADNMSLVSSHTPFKHHIIEVWNTSSRDISSKIAMP